MVASAIATTRFAARATEVIARVKSKRFGFRSPEAFRAFVAELLDAGGGRCALTGLTIDLPGAGADPSLLPSLDRKDSSRGYERDNLQIVCRFVNFWKRATPDAEFRRLIALLRAT